MNVLIFGATGMVGRGVLRECLNADDVVAVTTVGRSRVDVQHDKLHQVTAPDLFDVDRYAKALVGVDACFFCLGVQSTGMSEENYTRLTHDLTLAIAERLAGLNPRMTFIYVSGAGTDATELGRAMWARVKGRTENDLRALSFDAVYLFRPAAILPVNGERSKTASYRMFYSALGWLLRPLRPLSRGYILTTEGVGQAMLQAARSGWSLVVLEPPEIVKAAKAGSQGQ
jgi:uncharacterized protein YbjT (DUF2867 family)